MTLPNYLPTGNELVGTMITNTISLGAGGLIDTPSGISGRMLYVQTLALPVTAVTNTDFTMSLPPGCILHSAKVYTITAYTGTTANISLGNAAAGAQYVTAVSIASVGLVTLTMLAAQAPAFLSFPTGSPNLFIRIAQSTTPTAVGAGTLILTYSV
jgi:hypothetical protein